MTTRILSIFAFVFLLPAYGISQSVYDMSDQQQRGLTYQLYTQVPDRVFEAVTDVFGNSESGMRVEGWEVMTSEKSIRTIETEWREMGGSQSVSGGAVRGGGEKDERYKITAKVTDENDGARVSFELNKQRKFGNPRAEDRWRTFTTKKSTAEQHLKPLFEALEKQDLNIKE